MNKSTALNISLSPATLAHLQEEHPIQWSTSSILYLGIQLAPSIQATAETNYSILRAHIRKELGQWKH